MNRDDQELQKRIHRDSDNAIKVKKLAKSVLSEYSLDPGPIDFSRGRTDSQYNRIEYGLNKIDSLKEIIKQPFHAMVEVVTEVRGQTGRDIRQLWYANEHTSTNEVLKSNNENINVLAWTHPGIQIALSSTLNENQSLEESYITLTKVRTIARAKFEEVVPEISGLYEPGGSIHAKEKIEPKTGLKSVKLGMTHEQVQAFISRMDGLMFVSGAPGSGKTTVAFQRIRFLFDQQGERHDNLGRKQYIPDRTRVFLANPNLVDFSRQLLNELNIPESIISDIKSFIDNYLENTWLYKHNARPIQKKLTTLEKRARAAFFGLLKSESMPKLWRVYQDQIINRIGQTDDSKWMTLQTKQNKSFLALAKSLKHHAQSASISDRPFSSMLRMDMVYKMVSDSYENARENLTVEERLSFDNHFMHWLFWVYDPINALKTFFTSTREEGALRIRKGTGSRANETEVMEQIFAGWAERQYGPEERPWLAWLLRFVLPEIDMQQSHFREIPSALAEFGGRESRLTLVVIDEAQDLSIAEASFIISFVDPGGAVTISADFRQVVSPVHGMVERSALDFGNPLKDLNAQQIFPFARNMRQSREIGLFLQAFHQSAFGEIAQFEVNQSLNDIKPQLFLLNSIDHALRISQLFKVLSNSETVKTVALLQINEDEEAMLRLRNSLQQHNVPLAPIWEAFGERKLITTSVERIKGLEFDACIVLGIDQIERSSLNFTLNRAYVALSRPTRRLALICEEFPALIRKIDSALYDTKRFEG